MRRMVVSGTMLTAALALGSLDAQAPSSGETAGCEPVCTKGGATTLSPPDNPHLRAGAQFGYKLAGSEQIDDISDFFSVRTEVFVKKYGSDEKFRVPFIGNFGKLSFEDPTNTAGKLKELINSTSGLQITVSPYTSLPSWQRLSRTVVYANVGGKFNRQRSMADSTDFQWINQFRLSLGSDVSVDIGQSRPLSVITEAVYGFIGADKARSVLARDEGYLMSLEGTVIIPLPAVTNLSVIAQAVGVRGGAPLWRVGTLIYAPQGK